LYEIEGKKGEQYTSQMLLADLKKHSSKPCAELFDSLLADIQKFSGASAFADDVCLVAMEMANSLPESK
jgi:serine phosphatase RsbU (regulator of sigma subunit)